MVHTSRFPDPASSSDQKIPFATFFCRETAHFADYIALEDPATDETITFNELPVRLHSVKKRLSSLGLMSGDRVGCLAGNSINFILLSFAAGQLGLTLFPLNPACKKFEIEKYLASVQWMFVDEHCRQKAEEVADSLKELKSIFSLDVLDSEPEASEHEEKGEEEQEFDVETTAFVFFSSGTTGTPKGIRIPHRVLIAHCELARTIGSLPAPSLLPVLSPEDTVHGVMPFFHAGGLLSLIVMMFQGAKVILNRKYDETKFLDILMNKQVTVVNAVPAVLPTLSSLFLPSLRVVFVGAAPLCEVEAMEFMEKQPHCALVQMYGMTEAGVLIFMTPKGVDPAKHVGIALPGVQFKILRDDEEECPTGFPGDLWLKTTTMASGYLDSDESFPEWLDSGDVASVDEHGSVSVVGRTKEMIKVRGWQVSPYELEQAIVHGVQGVKECAVVGVPFGNTMQPHAFVTGRPAIDDVIQFVKDNFVSYKHLAGVSIVDELPRTTTGKLKRAELVQTTTLDDVAVYPLPLSADDEENATPVIL